MKTQAGRLLKGPVSDVDSDMLNLSTTYEVAESKTIHVPEDPTPQQRMAIVEASGCLDFWDDEEEDRYSQDDGDPV